MHSYQVWVWRAHIHDKGLELTSHRHRQIPYSALCSPFSWCTILEGQESLVATILTLCRIRGFCESASSENETEEERWVGTHL